MKINANLIRVGNIIENNGKQWAVLKTQIVQPGKGGAFITVEMRDIRTGTKTNERWRTADTVEKCNVEEKDCTFLFVDGDALTFMDQENFEQFNLTREVLGDAAAFLQDGMQVAVDFIEGSPVSVSLPEKVTMTVVEADPVVKGQTASSSYKPAKLENGLKILVPPFIAEGEKIIVNTGDCSYVERAK
ncbi:elongation factor P [Magnetospirillum gryphiswaldense]|jgi:elongation factor P|uniref:Elongation factor P n=2 Tax=Magnetospirillum gryphiswaldense TaxID=55518 RepID=V6EYZ8_MAGGM|nr:elongation factor P [Magnetospirillum gryphiswaldense]AVM74450.1 Elongation factor P [Magnetospirillum gryphiswaldense MSR-1]AVM78353.1 Elongation factor P [Magnetospirillum gryphiswaldense]CAM75235.1 Translation elongation factor P [Magnetospirillum gryphiswaldense MSR-1]CDK97453.1 Elongation factor P (EF-P) [Magnetospirillum gryphiswaldense MSR-1 v2]